MINIQEIFSLNSDALAAVILIFLSPMLNEIDYRNFF
jgi:hypothetical protein